MHCSRTCVFCSQQSGGSDGASGAAGEQRREEGRDRSFNRTDIQPHDLDWPSSSVSRESLDLCVVKEEKGGIPHTSRSSSCLEHPFPPFTRAPEGSASTAHTLSVTVVGVHAGRRPTSVNEPSSTSSTSDFGQQTALRHPAATRPNGPAAAAAPADGCRPLHYSSERRDVL